MKFLATSLDVTMLSAVYSVVVCPSVRLLRAIDGFAQSIRLFSAVDCRKVSHLLHH